MSTQSTAFLLAVMLGVISSTIGFVLYRYGQAYIKYKGARFGGAVAVAGVAFYLMSGFYFRQMESANRAEEAARFKLRAAANEYDTCVAQERSSGLTSCKYQADALRDASYALLH